MDADEQQTERRGSNNEQCELGMRVQEHRGERKGDVDAARQQRAGFGRLSLRVCRSATGHLLEVFGVPSPLHGDL